MCPISSGWEIDVQGMSHFHSEAGCGRVDVCRWGGGSCESSLLVVVLVEASSKVCGSWESVCNWIAGRVEHGDGAECGGCQCDLAWIPCNVFASWWKDD
jgi:hypothetical protein